MSEITQLESGRARVNSGTEALKARAELGCEQPAPQGISGYLGRHQALQSQEQLKCSNHELPTNLGRKVGN